MRGYLAASSAASAQRQASGLGRAFRGTFATRAASGDGDGSGAPSGGRGIRTTVLMVFAFLLVAVSIPSAAMAVSPQTGTASNLTATGATLNGTINPEGTELEECKFEYGVDTSYGQTVPCVESPAAIGSGGSPVAVHADVAGLNSGSSYSFRLVAKSSLGTVEGADASFITLGPIIEGESFSGVSDTSATLKAIVNPHGEATGYLFEYVSQAQFEASGYTEASSLPASGEAIGSGTEAVSVSQEASGLTPATIYHFRVVATNPSASVQGADRTFTTYQSSPSFELCPANEAFRGGLVTQLPDCRAYEQASPVDKHGADISGARDKFQAASGGDAVTFFATAGLPGGVGSQDFPIFLARREAGAWSTRGLLPPPSYGRTATLDGWTPDLEYFMGKAGTFGVKSRYLVRRSSDDSFAQISDAPGSRTSYLAGVSADGSKVFFESQAFLTPEAADEEAPNLYVWDRETNTITLAGVLPNSACLTPPCVPAEGSFAGSFRWSSAYDFSETVHNPSSEVAYFQEDHAVSTNGDRAFFTEAGTGQLYMREDAAEPGATTVHVNASQRSIPDPHGTQPAVFLRATPSGSVAYFLSCEKLTDDSTAFSSAVGTCKSGQDGRDLYAYDTASGDLTDLTVDTDATGPHGADVQGLVGTSDDGSYVYFAANADLDGDGPATLGNCRPAEGGGSLGFCNLYLSHAGVVTSVARLDVSGLEGFGGPSNWEQFDVSRWVKTARVSADGKTLLFASKATLTPGAQGAQFYRYHDGEGLNCITCDPTGNTSGKGGGAEFGGAEATLQTINATSFLQTESHSYTRTRNLSADGNRVFFETPAKLVTADTNGDGGCPRVGYQQDPACLDVYEWEANGSGSCESSAQNGGCLYLLSTGVSSQPAWFGDASESGDDVFIFTRDSLVPQDQDQARDVYDVRVDGGLVSQHPESLPDCEGEACRGAGTSAPETTGAGSAVFQGDGNPPIKRHHKKKHHKKHHKKKHHKRSHKRAGHSRGGAK